MPLMRVRVADTEAIAQYYPTFRGVRVRKIMTVNHDGKGRRKISLDKDNQEQLEKIIYEGIQSNVAAAREAA